MTYDIYQIAERIARHLASAGFEVSTEGSRISPSQYIYAQLGEDGETAKIRVSDHSAHAADYHVGPYADMDWTRPIVALCTTRGLPLPAATRRVLTLRAGRTAAIQARIAADLRDIPAPQQRDPRIEGAVAALDVTGLNARQRKRRRQQYRDRLLAASCAS